MAEKIPTVQDIFKKMKELVDSGSVYLFESVEDEGEEYYFKPFKGKPVFVGSELYVEVVESNGVLGKGVEATIDPYEYCFTKVTKVEE